MSDSRDPYIVVGADASAGAETALDWAVDDAAKRRAQLRIGHAWSLATHLLPDADRGHLVEAAQKAAEELVERAARRALARRPELDVTAEPLPGEPAVNLLSMADGADLLVVGARGLGRFEPVLLGSVSETVAAHATCPVAVVRSTGSAAGPVVVGVAPDEARGPLEFAFVEAERRGVPLHAVRTWLHPQALPGQAVVPPHETAERDRGEGEELDALLAPVRESFPDVPVETEARLAEPEAALVEASRAASLVVVGARRHRGRFGLPFGRVTRRVLHHAHCPVVVVPV
ncbi:universal stress protein [Streptantibioticus ferralitis]|uniref:Universal stress protein n=1 Tax=Streptantibioticus ferralitis TaxID=236510 RepID=A0ABT5YTM6_9ACTN|nr:universal stress protein [Streptantibioticus ferralitis]MDF2254962.1 universal stress protein [Streptantibioticus ferralitis]